MNAKKVGILSAGSWGTAVGSAIADNGHEVTLWSREECVVRSVNEMHENAKFLPSFTLNPNVCASQDIEKVASNKDFLIFATPSLYVADVAKKIGGIGDIRDGKTEIGILTKGFIATEDGPQFLTQMIENVLPPFYKMRTAYISGPSHAEEVAAKKVTGLIVASENPMTSIKFRELLKSNRLLVYSSLDVFGVQVCAAMKNIVAIAFGCADALAKKSDIFGDNSQSLLLAAGLNEIMRVGIEVGATHAETFTSIAGVGDLDVTCRSKYGRNRRFGIEIVENGILDGFSSLDDLISNIGKIGYLPEGVIACKHVRALEARHSLKLPLCNGLYRILNKEIRPEELLTEVLEN